jgi:hypothetical protein
MRQTDGRMADERTLTNRRLRSCIASSKKNEGATRMEDVDPIIYVMADAGKYGDVLGALLFLVAHKPNCCNPHNYSKNRSHVYFR